MRPRWIRGVVARLAGRGLLGERFSYEVPIRMPICGQLLADHGRNMGGRKTAAAEIMPLVEPGQGPGMAPGAEFDGVVRIEDDRAGFAAFVPVYAEDRIIPRRVYAVVASPGCGGDDQTLVMGLLAQSRDGRTVPFLFGSQAEMDDLHVFPDGPIEAGDQQPGGCGQVVLENFQRPDACSRKGFPEYAGNGGSMTDAVFETSLLDDCSPVAEVETHSAGNPLDMGMGRIDAAVDDGDVDTHEPVPVLRLLTILPPCSREMT